MGRKKETEVVNSAEDTAAAATETENKKENSTAAVPAEQRLESAPTFTQEQVNDMIKAAVAQALASQTPQVVQVAADVEKVQFLFQAEVSDENVFDVGQNGVYGRVIGKTGTFYVPKSDLSRVMDSLFRQLMEKRWIIVVSGLNGEEREAFGVNYREGEVLDRKAFAKLVELGKGILDVYPKLCAGHREMVAKRYNEAYLAGNPWVTREIVTELNNMSRTLGSENGDFTAIIEAMNVADARK